MKAGTGLYGYFKVIVLAILLSSVFVLVAGNSLAAKPEKTSGQAFNMLDYRIPEGTKNNYRVTKYVDGQSFQDFMYMENIGHELIWANSNGSQNVYSISITERGLVFSGFIQYDEYGNEAMRATYDHPIYWQNPAGAKSIGESWAEGFVTTEEWSDGATEERTESHVITLLGKESVTIDGITYADCLKLYRNTANADKTIIWMGKGIGTVKRLYVYPAGQGRVMELISRETHVPEYLVLDKYLQYRVYDGGIEDKFQSWTAVTKDGAPITAADISKLTIIDPNQQPLTPTSSSLYEYVNTYAGWTTSSYPDWYSEGASVGAGIIQKFDNYDDLPAGDYTFVLETTDGQEISNSLYYPGKVIMPIVDDTTMVAEWLGDGSLHLSWAPVIGDFDQYRLLMFDSSGADILYGRVDPPLSSVILPPELLSIFEQAGSSAPVTWIVQVRDYLGNYNYARSYSAHIPLP
jgi:hypothetical protein